MTGTLGEAAWRLAFGDLAPEQVFALREGTAWQFLPGGAADRYVGLLAIADLDARLLTDDLPIDAYLDKGFDSWLKRQQR